ncbi:hypothetical protein [Denitromonas ohlonensis]|uniref:Uncharacterized protein n=2 Tax=Denitromonas TaxID=139331 RepID=A0A557SKN7_9RHOO|nr:hypothetical protein [Denitromonas ohlonensis]TVO68108.1 hypothetical protein FHP90_05910 [Denitromonas ohlonensis]TVO77987.1 hypothetical protein FHP89_05750 [Denitromonas ohlonensis]
MRLIRTTLRLLLLYVLSSGAAFSSQSAITLTELLELNHDFHRRHESSALGVPRSFDWADSPKVEAGNDRGGFSAATGWGHAFWSVGTVGNPGDLEIRNFQTYICHGVERKWVQLQKGRIEGAEFRADYKNNAATKPMKFLHQNGFDAVVFQAGRSFHFWPASGRKKMPAGTICGFVVILEARSPGMASGVTGGGYLIGLGADYWVSVTASWDSYKTNKGVSLGRLKLVGKDWEWFGMSTAADEDLAELHSSGVLWE